MFKKFLLLVTLTLFACNLSAQTITQTPSANAYANSKQPVWQAFKMNAQYRGGIKKGFRDIGCGIAYFSDLPNGDKQIATKICAVTPDKKHKTYAFKLNMQVALKSSSINIKSNAQSQFKGFDKSSNEQVKQLMALWAYLRHCYRNNIPISPQLTIDNEKIIIKDKIFKRKHRKRHISKRRRRRRRRKKLILQKRQITIRWVKNKKFKGKFFLYLDGKTKQWKLEKFRFNNKKVSVSLISISMKYITKKFAAKEPYKSWVFSK